MPRARRSPSTLRNRLRDLAASLGGARVVKLRDARRAFEHVYVRDVIARLGDRAAAARALGIGLSTLKEKIRPPR